MIEHLPTLLILALMGWMLSAPWLADRQERRERERREARKEYDWIFDGRDEG